MLSNENACVSVVFPSPVWPSASHPPPRGGLYKLQFEKTEFLILLDRLRSYANEVKPHLVTNCEVIGELHCYKTTLEKEIFNDTMPSTSNMIYNFCGLWEIEVKKGIYKFICILLK